MSNNIYTYHNKSITGWFITILLFFGIGGYTNYTQPISYQESIELVVWDIESATRTLSFTKALYPKQDCNSYTAIKLLSKLHSSISVTKSKEFDTAISLTITHRIFLSQRNTHSSEDHSFQLG